MEEVSKITVIALMQFSNGDISMFKGEIRELDSETAETLIDNNLVAEYNPSIGGVLVITVDDNDALDATWTEIANAMVSGGAVIASYDGDDLIGVTCITSVGYDLETMKYYVADSMETEYISETKDGYPAIAAIDNGEVH